MAEAAETLDPSSSASSSDGIPSRSEDSDSGSDYGASLAFDLFDPADLRFSPDPVFQIDEHEDDVPVGGSDWGAEEFFLGRSSSASDSAEFSCPCPVDGSGLRIVDFDSDSDEQIVAIGDERNVEDAGLPICWDCLHIEDERRYGNEEFEWEEVDDDVNLEEREVVSMMGVADDDMFRDMVNEHEEVVSMWEVLLSVNNMGRNPMDPDDFDGDEGFVYTAEHDIVIGLPDHDSSLKGTPPAAKSVVESLPSVVLTEEDIVKNNTTCAVCKDEIPVNEWAKKLPCCHYYHEECILPWLAIRNTCPLCRFELLTDDPEYENLKARRIANTASADEPQTSWRRNRCSEERNKRWVLTWKGGSGTVRLAQCIKLPNLKKFLTVFEYGLCSTLA